MNYLHSHKRRKTIIDDGYSSYLVNEATFVGKYQIPALKETNSDSVPILMMPFDKRKKTNPSLTTLHFYMHDITFRQILTNTKHYLSELKNFKSVVSPDCSLYRDMPLCLQISNTYLNRAVAFYLQNNGVNVIPNVRWGDERSYEFCFDGLPFESIYCVSNHGCYKSAEDRHYFDLGLRKMISLLKPKIIIVYGTLSEEIKSQYINEVTFFVHEPYRGNKKGGSL